MKACLKSAGMVDSLMQRFSKFVIGGSKTSKHDLSSDVGRKSSAHVELDKDSIAALTSEREAGSNVDRIGG